MPARLQPLSRRPRGAALIGRAFPWVLVSVILLFARGNIMADPVDYYVLLQRLVRSGDPPLVENTHFAEQRSPGFPLLSLPAYSALRYLVSPLVRTEQITEYPSPPGPFGRAPSELQPLPPQPVSAVQLFFKDFHLPGGNGVLRWTVLGALILTSYAFLFVGLSFMRRTLRLPAGGDHPLLLPLALVASPFLLFNIIVTPSYATLTAFGMSAAFVFFFLRGFDGRPVDQLLAGLSVGMLVLIRLEAAVAALALCACLLVYRQYRFLARFVAMGALSLLLLLASNVRLFGAPLHLGILRGDINLLTFNLAYIVDAAVNPASGILFWSPLGVAGIVALLYSRYPALRSLGLAAAALVILYLLRVPVMYLCVGAGPRAIGGISVGCPETRWQALGLVRSDVNRYMTLLLPFALPGIQRWLSRRQRERPEAA